LTRTYIDENKDDKEDEWLLPAPKKQRASAPQEKENIAPGWRRSGRLFVSAGPTYEEMDLDLRDVVGSCGDT
jgi:hypothetical protein